MATAEKALIDHDETDAHHNSEEEQNVDDTILKDTKYSWFVCCCAFLSQVFILGVLHAFGVFFVEFVKEFNSPKGQAAWIGSLAYGLSMTFGPVTSMLVRRFGYSKVMMTGAAICAGSVIASSFATSIPQLFISFSVLYGIGTCMATGPTMTITAVYFDKYLTIATGITVSGSSFGTLIMGPLSQVLIDSIGWRNAFRIYSGLHIITMLMDSRIKDSIPRSRNLEKKKSFLYDFRIWKNRVFVVWTAAITLVMFGFYIPYVHLLFARHQPSNWKEEFSLVSYAIDQGISPDKAAILMMVLGAATASGRLMFGKIVQMGVLNRLHMHQLSMVVTGTGVMLLPLITSYLGIILYVVTVGLVDGCYVVLLPILTTSLVGIENSVLAWGFLIGTSSVTFTLGPPVAGALYDMTGSYNLAFHCAGIPIVTGAIILFLIPWAKRTSRQPNAMEIVNEYTVSDTFRMNSMSEPDDEKTRSAMIATVDDVIQTIAIPTSSFLTVRSVATSTDDQMIVKDQSTSTSESTSYRRRPLDIEDALSQLSQNDVMFSEMMNRSFTSDRGHPHDSDSSQYIPRIPPPSDPGRCYNAPNQDQLSVSSAKPGSSHSRPSVQSSLAADLIQVSSGFIHGSVSDDVFLPSASHLFNLSAMTPNVDLASGSHSRTDSWGEQQTSAGASRSTADESVVKPEEGFEQTISDQVDKLIETLKSPGQDEADQYNVEDTIQGFQTLQRFQKEEINVAVPSDFPAFSAPQPYHGSPERHPTESNLAHSFGSENQLTVIPGQNPLTKNKPRPGTKLEELFVEPENLRTARSSSFEVVEVDSSDSVRQTASTTGEIDVFKHLFDDEEDQDVSEVKYYQGERDAKDYPREGETKEND